MSTKGKGRIHVTERGTRITMGQEAKFDRIKIYYNTGKDRTVSRIQIDVPKRKDIRPYYYKRKK